MRATTLFAAFMAVACHLAFGATPGKTLDCEEAFVGAGWAGVYAAYRRALTAKDASKLCLFEASHRAGGRTYSVEVRPTDASGEKFVLDVGAYRFSPDMHLPGDLILRHLKLPTQCYEPRCLPANVDFPSKFMFNYTAPLRRIVDPTTGRTGGYVTAINVLIGRLKTMGVRVFMYTKLTQVAAHDAQNGMTTLTFISERHGVDMQATSRFVVLNLPRNHLLNIKGVGSLVAKRTMGMLKCVRFDMPKNVFPKKIPVDGSTSLSKAYLYYSDAWWITKINQTIGEYPEDSFEPILTSAGIYFALHWSDGPTVCNKDKTKCHGFLEVYYSVSNETFYAHVPQTDPYGTLDRSTSSAAAEKLDTLHAALMEAIHPLLRGRKDKFVAPSLLVVGRWNRPNETFPYGYGYTVSARLRPRNSSQSVTSLPPGTHEGILFSRSFGQPGKSMQCSWADRSGVP